MTSRSIINEIITTVNAYLTFTMQNEIDVDDPSRAGLVRPGLLQDDPTRYKVVVMTYPNDPDSETGWLHEIVAANANGATLNPPPYELGGGEMWYRRFSVTLELFYNPNVDRETSRQLSNVILQRAEHAIATCDMPDVRVDDFGETAIQFRVMKSQITQGGGEGQFIWYGKIWFQALTGKSTL